MAHLLLEEDSLVLECAQQFHRCSTFLLAIKIIILHDFIRADESKITFISAFSR
jgi:hypothetical protein